MIMKRVFKYLNKDNIQLAEDTEFISTFCRTFDECERSIWLGVPLCILMSVGLHYIVDSYVPLQAIFIGAIAGFIGTLINMPLQWVTMQGIVLAYFKKLDYQDQIDFCKRFNFPIEEEPYTHKKFYDVYMYRIDLED